MKKSCMFTLSSTLTAIVLVNITLFLCMSVYIFLSFTVVNKRLKKVLGLAMNNSG